MRVQLSRCRLKLPLVTCGIATDPEENPLIYSLSGTDAASFAIGTTIDGQLTTRKKLDHEMKSTYEVMVTASDGTLEVRPNHGYHHRQ